MSEVAVYQLDDKLAGRAIETEQMLLGGLLLSNKSYWKICDRLTPEHFCEPIHSEIYREIGLRVSQGKRADGVTLAPAFEAALSEVGGASYFSRLAGVGCAPLSMVDYAETLRDIAIRRELSGVAEELSHAANNARDDIKPDAIIADLEAHLHEIATRGGFQTRDRSLYSAATDVIGAAQRAREQGAHRGIWSGLRAFDKVNGPMLPGDLIVIGGATSMGKTALAQQILWNACRQFKTDENGNRIRGARCAAFSMEMTGEQYASRHICQISRVPVEKMEDGNLTDQELHAMSDSAERMRDMPFSIEDTRRMTVAQIRSICRRKQHMQGLDLILIDHLHFIAPPDKRMQKLDAIEWNVSEIKALAGELQIPVILISHLNRGLWGRDDKRPQLSDLHGASAIEKDADCVCFVHREEYWLRREQPDPSSKDYIDWGAALDACKNIAEVINGKRRRGQALQTARCYFDGETTQFNDLQGDA